MNGLALRSFGHNEHEGSQRAQWWKFNPGAWHGDSRENNLVSFVSSLCPLWP